jgi:hypothetical protein
MAPAARVRDLLRHNVLRQRLAPDFSADNMTWSSKTGTLLKLRHEVGVVEHADGQRVAVAALTDSTVPAAVQPAAEARMALVARRLHDELARAVRPTRSTAPSDSWAHKPKRPRTCPQGDPLTGHGGDWVQGRTFRTTPARPWRVSRLGCPQTCRATSRVAPHCDTSFRGVWGELAGADRGRLWTEEVTADEVAEVAASARASRRAAVAGGSGGSP